MVADRELTCFFSGKTIHKGEEYTLMVDETDDGKVIDYFDIHHEAMFLIEVLDMYGIGTDNDGFCAQDYDDMVDDAFANLPLTDDEFEDYICSDNPFVKHDVVYKYYKNKMKEIGVYYI